MPTLEIQSCNYGDGKGDYIFSTNSLSNHDLHHSQITSSAVNPSSFISCCLFVEVYIFINLFPITLFESDEVYRYANIPLISL